MKKILLIYFFAFCGCLGFCPDSQAKILEKIVWAGMYCNWSLSDDGVMVIKGTGKMELQEDMLDVYKDKIKKIRVSEGITDLGKLGFSNCEDMNIEEIILPSSIRKLRKNAFTGCESVKKITLPKRIKKIEEKTFYKCNKLEELVIPDSVEVIEKNAVYQCKALKKVVLPKHLKKTSVVFNKCYSLRKIVNRSSISILLNMASNRRIWKCRGKAIRKLRPKATAESKGTKYKLTYDLNGGNVQERLPKYRYCGDESKVPAAKKEGYLFLGWQDRTAWHPTDKFIQYSSKDLRLTALFVKINIKRVEGSGGNKICCNIWDDNFTVNVSGWGDVSLHYYLSVSADEGKHWTEVSSYGNGTDEVSWDDLIGYEPGKGCIYMLGHVPVESEDIYFFQDWCLRGKMILE